MRTIDRISNICAHLSAWLYFAIGIIVTYEVIVRYVFTAPTIWAEEISQFLQIWATYLAAAYVLKTRQLIVIETFVSRMSGPVRFGLDVFQLLVIAGFCVIAIWYGTEIAIDSIVQGRSTSTMLGVPKWMTESAVPFCFSILLAQALAELTRLFCPQPANTSGDAPQ
ncbi:MAG: TRAP transporter small permease [Rhodospirillales bacterium]|nr:TRAP transporter small permease [Rhodospirillales bacterium]